MGFLLLEFVICEVNGLLLYGGLIFFVWEGDVYDFIIFELVGGKIFVIMFFGDCNDVVCVGVIGGMDLNDGEWYYIEVYWDGLVSDYI